MPWRGAVAEGVSGLLCTIPAVEWRLILMVLLLRISTNASVTRQGG